MTSSESDEADDSSDEEFFDENHKALSPHLSAPANRLGSGKKKSALSLFAVNNKTTNSGNKRSDLDNGFDDIDIAATFVEEDDNGDDDDDSDVDADEDDGSEAGDRMTKDAFTISFSQKEAEVLKTSNNKKKSSSSNMTSTPSFVKSMNEVNHCDLDLLLLFQKKTSKKKRYPRPIL